jgi:5'-3' exoribonuclease 2
MNQQRSRRFRSAQEAREHAELEEHIRQELVKAGQGVPPSKKPWDSNVITPGTPFMLNLANYVRFYIRKRISTDKAWKDIVVIFSDASLPGEGEHKIMENVRLQRSQPGYNPNTVHVLHGLDADLIMLALATHEMHFYILREVVTFGRKSLEQMEQRQLENGFQDAQRLLDEEAGPEAMGLFENQQKPLQRVSIPILREYLASEFAVCLAPGALPFAPSLERLIDDVVFLCFFVGNDFLPHLPSLDIRDGALDFLFNVYKRVLPTFGDFITNHGGQVNLSHVDVILAEVGAIEDYVFEMKHRNEEREQQRREEMKARRKSGQKLDAPPVVAAASFQAPIGRAAKILEKRKGKHGADQTVALGRGHVTKEESRKDLKANKMVAEAEANAQAALELKRSLLGAMTEKKEIMSIVTETKSEDMEIDSSFVKHDEEAGADHTKTEGGSESGTKRKLEEIDSDSAIKAENKNWEEGAVRSEEEAEFEDDVNSDDNDADEEDEVEEIIEEEAEKVEVPAEIDPELVTAFKEKIKSAKAKQLDEFSKNVEDKVRLHEKGWKVRSELRPSCRAVFIQTMLI